MIGSCVCSEESGAGPGTGAGSWNPVVGTGRVGDSTGFFKPVSVTG